MFDESLKTIEYVWRNRTNSMKTKEYAGQTSPNPLKTKHSVWQTQSNSLKTKKCLKFRVQLTEDKGVCLTNNSTHWIYVLHISNEVIANAKAFMRLSLISFSSIFFFFFFSVFEQFLLFFNFWLVKYTFSLCKNLNIKGIIMIVIILHEENIIIQKMRYRSWF